MTRSGPRLAPRVIILYLGPFGPPPSTSKSPQFSMTSGISSTYALPRQMQAEESRPHTPTCLRKNDRPDGHNCRPTRQLRGRPGRWPQLSADRPGSCEAGQVRKTEAVCGTRVTHHIKDLSHLTQQTTYMYICNARYAHMRLRRTSLCTVTLCTHVAPPSHKLKLMHSHVCTCTSRHTIYTFRPRGRP